MQQNLINKTFQREIDAAFGLRLSTYIEKKE